MDFMPEAETPARILREIKERADRVYHLKLAATKAEQDFKDAKAQLLDIMVEAGVDKFAAEACNITAKKKTSVTVPKDAGKKRELFDYIAKWQGGDVLQEMLTINPRSFSAWHDAEVEKHNKNGDLDFKLEMLEPYTYDSLGITKRRKAK